MPRARREPPAASEAVGYEPAVAQEPAAAREQRPPRGRPAPREAQPDEAPRRVRPKTAGTGMETYRIEVGSTHGIKPSNVVGAIANEAGIEGVHIGRIDIREDHSFVDLPEGMPKQIFKMLQKVLVAGRELRISKASERAPGTRPTGPRPAGPRT